MYLSMTIRAQQNAFFRFGYYFMKIFRATSVEFNSSVFRGRVNMVPMQQNNFIKPATATLASSLPFKPHIYNRTSEKKSFSVRYSFLGVFCSVLLSCDFSFRWISGVRLPFIFSHTGFTLATIAWFLVCRLVERRKRLSLFTFGTLFPSCHFYFRNTHITSCGNPEISQRKAVRKPLFGRTTLSFGF